jgi:succinylglutamate desuccinylase
MPTNPVLNNKTNETPDRVFHYIKGNRSGRTIVFFAGIHGNEVAGVKAINNTLKKIDPSDVGGEIYGVYGNIKALQKNKRFIDLDLNRLWTLNNIKTIVEKEGLLNEDLEQYELFHFIKQLLATINNPVYFIDLHTTSSKSVPFITINDALINRDFSKCFPLPVVLGIEEHLEGPLLSYLNTLGYVSLGFESGQHKDPQAVKNAEAFIYLTLVYSGLIKSSRFNNLEFYKNNLKSAAKNMNSIFEVIYKYHISSKDVFTMKRGFESFQDIKKGTLLAASNGKNIYAKHNAMLFMPLYQKSGNDGFFIIKPVHPFFLELSRWLRRIKAEHLLTFLPGISWHNKPLGILKVNLSTARFLAKSIFHLLGYRNKKLNKTHLLLYNRERVSKKEMYKKEQWY